MKFIVVLLIAGIAALMAFMALRGECPGGAVVFSESQCRQSGSFDAATCGLIFRAADSVTARASTVYTNEPACMRDHESCVRSGNTQGFTPVPAGFCVTSVAGRVVSQEPVYRRINAAPVGGRP